MTVSATFVEVSLMDTEMMGRLPVDATPFLVFIAS
jgi:hypothetical protein